MVRVFGFPTSKTHTHIYVTKPTQFLPSLLFSLFSEGYKPTPTYVTKSTQFLPSIFTVFPFFWRYYTYFSENKLHFQFPWHLYSHVPPPRVDLEPADFVSATQDSTFNERAILHEWNLLLYHGIKPASAATQDSTFNERAILHEWNPLWYQGIKPASAATQDSKVQWKSYAPWVKSIVVPGNQTCISSNAKLDI